ncbi:MAG: DUF937 domain-containing protein [Rhizobiaceae bacterium]
MLNLFDMMTKAQSGGGVDLLARQFNLSQQQAQLALEALLPAFSEGLKRNASDPYGVGSFLSALSTGQHAKYFENPAAAFTPAGMQEGNGILGHLFGSKELSRAVTAQAAQATGIGQEVLKQMLPAIAAMIMGGLFKQSTNQAQAAGFGGGSNPLGDIIEQMMRQGGGFGMPQRPAEAPNPLDNPFGKILEGMFGGGQPQPEPRRQTQQPGPMDNPLGRIFEEMMGAGRASAPQPEPSPRKTSRNNPSGRARTPYDDLFGDMFETGAKQRDDYQKTVGSIFDQFLQGMDRQR